MNLDEIRQQIDSTDSDIIKLLSKRAGLVSAAGKLKTDEQSVRDPKRVEQVIEQVKAKAFDAGLGPVIAEEIYRTIIGCFVREELKEFAENLVYHEKHGFRECGRFKGSAESSDRTLISSGCRSLFSMKHIGHVNAHGKAIDSAIVLAVVLLL